LVKKCPQCRGVAIGLSRKFKAPRKNDLAQWKKVEYLVRNGFYFEPIGEPYPKTLRDAMEFVTRNRHLAVQRSHEPMSR